MTEVQNAKYIMFETIDGVFKEYPDVVNSVEPLQNAFTVFTGSLSRIKDLMVRQTYNKTGMTNDKQAAKEAMAKLGADLAAAGMAYAKENQNHTLMAYFDYSYSDIRFVGHTESENVARVILEELKKTGPLPDFLVTQEDITEYENLIERFSSIQEDTSVANTESVVATRELKVLFKEINDLLVYKLDVLCSRIQRQHPDFYASYNKAREVLGLSRGRKDETSDAA